MLLIKKINLKNRLIIIEMIEENEKITRAYKKVLDSCKNGKSKMIKEMIAYKIGERINLINMLKELRK